MRGLGDHLTIGERIAFHRRRRGYTQQVLAGLVGRSTDWLAKAESGRRKPPRIDMLAELARVLRVPLGDLLGKPVLMEDERQQDDVPAVRDALMSPRRLSRLLFGPEAESQLPSPGPVTPRVEAAWDDYQSGRLGKVIAALPGLLQTAQGLEDRAVRAAAERMESWAVSARIHHLAATTLAKVGESDMSWLAAERAMRAADESENALVLASAARSGTHALLANGRYDDALELAVTASRWLSARIEQSDPAAVSLLGMIHLRAAIAAARHQDRSTAMSLLDRAEELAEQLGSDGNYWHTCFGPTNVMLHRLSAELDLDNVSYVVEHGEVDVDHMAAERGVSHRIDFARALSLAGRADDAFAELRTAESVSPQLVRNNPRVRDTLRDLIKQSPVTSGARSSELFVMAQRCRAVQ
ncbi:helix-turn-helix domain-containing protein [Streptomyces europaeiscabiei]|uniref:helix-turn-helix domain-containing protein n=1 Tax=Streptomyces europaeiscabiei TaxID=146819 RepID=UPI0029B4403B|nr:helix-turn-helix domain-containing protein [Streptomyces europaeiscabiei]MDX3711264.1 helix-turn-helix domain-containing protein [Streptomyces europaeiscabiei]MDX3840088.1 helix-turn-helix domain-containing protein [Streptomyces europaeiscabiei]